MSDEYRETVIVTYPYDPSRNYVVQRDVEVTSGVFGGSRTNIKETEKRSVEDFIRQLQIRTGVGFMIPQLNDGRICYVMTNDITQYYAVEFSPSVRALLISGIGSLAIRGYPHSESYADIPYEPHVVKVSMPWLYLIIGITNRQCGVHAFYRPSQLTSPNDTLFLTNLTNTGSDGQLCMSFEEERARDSIVDKLNGIIQRFWTGEWNTDLNDNWRHYARRDDHPHNHIEWQDKSAANPDYALTLSWTPSLHTLESFLRGKFDGSI